MIVADRVDRRLGDAEAARAAGLGAQTYIASNSRAATIAASTRTRMSSEPSNRT